MARHALEAIGDVEDAVADRVLADGVNRNHAQELLQHTPGKLLVPPQAQGHCALLPQGAWRDGCEAHSRGLRDPACKAGYAKTNCRVWGCI